MPDVELSLEDALTIAVRHHEAGDAATTQYICRQILAMVPRQADALHLLGISAEQTGDFASAIEHVRLAIAIDPTFAAAVRSLGRIYQAAGQGPEAIATYRQLIALRPADAEAHRQLAASLIAQGELDAAEASCWRAIELAPGNPQLQLELGNLHVLRGMTAQAIFVYSQTIDLLPSFAPAYSARATVLSEHGLFDEAMVDHRKAVELAPGEVGFRIEMAKTLSAAGDFAAAEACCRAALEMNPESAEAWECLGRVLQTHGRFEAAAAALQRSLAIAPRAAVAMRLGMMPRAAEREEIARLTAVLTDARASADEQVSAGFALGRMLDEAGRFDEAFATYAKANARFKDISARQGFSFHEQGLRSMVDGAIDSFTAKYFQERVGWGDASELPVFIVGMPRSGTSLVEQIAASHSQVFGAGERSDIAMIRSRLAVAEGGQSPRRWDRAVIAGEAADHVRRLGAMGDGRARVIDKMPGNWVDVGLIATLFPGARILFCEREARDTCLSCFFHRFAKHNYLFSYDLADCGRMWRQFDRLSGYWPGVLRLRSLVIRYEELVADLEGQSRRLIEFLGLPWEDRCLSFHETERPVLTSSFWQVRQPIYTGSVGRWKHYERHLTPLESVLDGPA